MSEKTQKPNFLNRRQRREMLRQRGILRAISKMSFFSETKTKIREQNREDGRKRHEAWVDHLETIRHSSLEERLAIAKENWKASGYNQEEIDMLEEAWAIGAVKNKETYREDKKKRLALQKKAEASRRNR